MDPREGAAAPLAATLLAPALVLMTLMAVHAGVTALLRSSDADTGWSPIALRVVASLAWLAGTVLLVRAVDALVWERYAPRRTGVRVPRLLRQFVGVVLFSFGTIAMVSHVWNVAVAAMLATTGVVGLVLGLALRNILADFFSGIALNFEQPFELDDYVRLRPPRQRDPVAGTVREINWRSTRIVTAEQVAISVPNSLVAASIIENLSQPQPQAEYELDVALDWRVDTALAESLLSAAGIESWARGATAGDQPPKLRLHELHGLAMVWRLVYRLDPSRPDRGPARHSLLAAVRRHLAFAGLRPTNLHPVTLPSGEDPPSPTPVVHERAEDRQRPITQLPLFQALTAEEQAELARGVVVRRQAIGDEVVCAGGPGDAMFVVVAGVLEVLLPQPGAAARRVGVLGPGDFFGEISMLTGAPRSASVVVLSAAILYEIPHALIAPLLHRRAELADALAQAVAEHQRADADTVAMPPAERRQRQRSLAQNLAARIRAFLHR